MRRAALAVTALALAGCGVSTPSSSPSAAAPDNPSAAASDSSTPSAAATSTAPAVAAGTVLLSLSGSGAKTTQKFTTGQDWDMSYSYDCSAFGQAGNFAVLVYGSDGQLSLDNSPINEIGSGKSDVTHYHNGGTFYLDINSECNWTVKVTTA